ncbi:hypothetical protein JXA47_07455 [Candidatus Sumerlaeota bacterium]|nr:hypothetical protein [Candidatus Sumerlaeota bacterium]
MSSEGNPFVLRLRERQGIWGAFHRSNTALIALALILHGSVAIALWQLGFEASVLITIFVVFQISCFALFLFMTLGTISYQVRTALRKHAWDELLVTPMSDRELVNGQLLMAMRPALILMWLTSPSLVLLVGLLIAMIINLEGWAMGLISGAMIILGLAAAYVLMALIIFFMAVMTFVSNLNTAGFLSRAGASLVNIVLLLMAPILFLFFAPLLFVIPAICWYQHRVLCVSLRERLLEGR